MDFWQSHYAEQARAQATAPPSADKANADYSQNAPTECSVCGETKPDVLLGICNADFAAYIAAKR